MRTNAFVQSGFAGLGLGLIKRRSQGCFVLLPKLDDILSQLSSMHMLKERSPLSESLLAMDRKLLLLCIIY